MDDPYIDVDDEDYVPHKRSEVSAARMSQKKRAIWEEAYKRSWDAIQEDSEGTLQAVLGIQNQKRRRYSCTWWLMV
jgi:hypothetical protein